MAAIGRDPDGFQIERAGFSAFGSGPIEQPGPIPEPNSLLLVGTGLLSAVGVRRWRQRKAS